MKISEKKGNRKLFQVGTKVTEKFGSTIGQCAFPRVAMWQWHLLVVKGGSCNTAQRSTQIRLRGAFGLRGTMKRRTSFLYLMRSKMGIHVSFKNKEIEA